MRHSWHRGLVALLLFLLCASLASSGAGPSSRAAAQSVPHIVEIKGLVEPGVTVNPELLQVLTEVIRTVDGVDQILSKEPGVNWLEPFSLTCTEECPVLVDWYNTILAGTDLRQRLDIRIFDIDPTHEHVHWMFTECWPSGIQGSINDAAGQFEPIFTMICEGFELEVYDPPPPPPLTFTVTKTDDTKDGACDADCSLREAIIAANGAGSPAVVQVGPGVYRLTRPGLEDNAGAGDLDVRASMTIVGAGTGETIIDAGGPTNVLDRVFQMMPGAGTRISVTIQDLTIQGGDTSLYNCRYNQPVGGGIRAYQTDLTLTNLSVVDNRVWCDDNYGEGGGVHFVDGTLQLNHVEIADNVANAGGGLRIGEVDDIVATVVTIEDSTVARNLSDVSDVSAYGGAIHATSDNTPLGLTLALTDSSVLDNVAQSAHYALGGGISFLGDGSNPSDGLLLTRTTVAGNRATRKAGGSRASQGGGVRVVNGNLTVDGSTVENNVAELADDSGLVAEGGGIYVEDPGSAFALEVVDSRIMNNQAVRGGGLYLHIDRSDITSSVIRGNVATGDPVNGFGEGGGLYLNQQSEGAHLLQDLEISHNTAAGNGAGLYLYADPPTLAAVVDAEVAYNESSGVGGGVYGSLSISHSALHHNLAQRGGGIGNDATATTVNVTNSTLSENQAELGGGVFNVGSLTLLHSTVTQNHAQRAAAGINNGDYIDWSETTGVVHLIHTIVADQQNGADCVNPGTLTTGGYNLDSDGSCLTAIATTGDMPSATADLGPSAVNPPGSTTSHAPSPASDARDAIPLLNGSCGESGVLDDQRGVARPLGDRCDVGAYEADALLEFSPNAPGVTPSGQTLLVARTVPPQPDLPIDFTIVAGSGSFSGDTILTETSGVTNAAGEAAVTLYAGDTQETIELLAALTGTPVTDRAIVHVGAGTEVAVQQRATDQTDEISDLAPDITLVKHGSGAPWLGVARFDGNPCVGNEQTLSAMGSFVDAFLEEVAHVANLEITVGYGDVEGDPALFWCDSAGQWLEHDAFTVDPINHTVTIEITPDSTPSLSDFDGTPLVVADSTPLAVTVGYFLALPNGDGTVDFLWQTVTENGTAGFRLLAVTDMGESPLTPELIPSAVIDSVVPTNYRFSTMTDATVFKLQEVGIDGSLTDHGPFQAGIEYGEYSLPGNVDLIPRVWLPVTWR